MDGPFAIFANDLAQPPLRVEALPGQANGLLLPAGQLDKTLDLLVDALEDGRQTLRGILRLLHEQRDLSVEFARQLLGRFDFLFGGHRPILPPPRL